MILVPILNPTAAMQLAAIADIEHRIMFWSGEIPGFWNN